MPLKLTAGDEVQGITDRPETLVEIMVRVSDALAPASLGMTAS